jgi:Mn-dependent DtxR family transcriptional regulator
MSKKLELEAWILRGSQKRIIFGLLKGRRIIPAQLYEEAIKINSKITRNSVSDVLREFKKKGVVQCLNPKEVKGRIYTLTKLGEEIAKEF